MEPIIEFENFTFKYRSQMEPTLRDINLKIYPGEKVLIIGPSGSGKSTLSNCINGLIPFSYEGDSTGTLRIEGKDPKKLGIFGLSKMVGTVLQDTDGQFIGLTVAEDIAFVLENDCMAQEEMFRKVDGVASAKHKGAAHGPHHAVHKSILPKHRLLDLSDKAFKAAQVLRLHVGGAPGQQAFVLHVPQHLAAAFQRGGGGFCLLLHTGSGPAGNRG